MSNYVAVEKGALCMALNVLDRAHKEEVADELRNNCVEIEVSPVWVQMEAMPPKGSGWYPVCSVKQGCAKPKSWPEAMSLFDIEAYAEGEPAWTDVDGAYTDVTHWLKLVCPAQSK